METEELVDYEEEMENQELITKSSFQQKFLLKPEIFRAIVDLGWEFPTTTQELLNQGILGGDIYCRSDPGTGKTSVHAISILQQLDVDAPGVQALILCHSIESARQTQDAYARLAKFQPNIKIALFHGGTAMGKERATLRDLPHIVIGTPGRIAHHIKDRKLWIGHVRFFVVDDCSVILGSSDSIKQIKNFLAMTRRDRQVMMFTSSFSLNIRNISIQFMRVPQILDEPMQDLPSEFQQVLIRTSSDVIPSLVQILNDIEFTQLMIITPSRMEADLIEHRLTEKNFSVIMIHDHMMAQDRIDRLLSFRDFHQRILVILRSLTIGLDIPRLNALIQFHVPSPGDYIQNAKLLRHNPCLVITIAIDVNQQDQHNAVIIEGTFNVPSLSDVSQLKEMMRMDSTSET